MIAYDAIIVAGGRGTRLGGVSKPDLSVGGMPLLDRTLAAVSGARETVIVGGPRREGVLWAVESPAGSGPAAAVAAGVAALGSGAAWTVVLAVDTPRASDAVVALLAMLPPDAGAGEDVDGAWLVDDTGYEQPLLAVYRTEALAARCADPQAGRSMRSLVAGLRMLQVTDADGVSRDLDTWEDAQFWKEQLG